MSWTFLTNHCHVLHAIAADPGIRIRDIADVCGITERGAQRIVGDLEAAGYLTHEKIGRRNRYSLNRDLPLRHHQGEHVQVGDLLKLLGV